MTTIHQTLVDQFEVCRELLFRSPSGAEAEAPSTEATCILDFALGEAVQVDFGKGPDITDAFTGKTFKTWIFVMTLCFSRHLYAEIVTDQKVSTWLSCHRRAFEFFNGVPAKVIIDNLEVRHYQGLLPGPGSAKIVRGTGRGIWFFDLPCPPRDPQKKGRVEAGVKVR